jgi:hypothetical protein
MLCTGPQPDHLHSLIRYAEGYPIDGLLVVQWEGSGTVQECYALNRALAAGVLWTGDLPDSSSAARAATRCSPGQADALGDLLVQDQCHLPSKGGGSESCPRFWSWPENVLAEQQTEAMLRNLDRAGVTHESLDVRRAFLAHRAVSLQTDCARETAALVGRAMLQKGLKSSPMLDQAIASLEKAADIARSIQEKGEEFHQRYCAGLSRRPMVAHFAEAPKSPEALLEKLRRFRDNPCPETWPFCRFSLHLDAIVVDPCAHYVAVEVSQDGQQFQSVYSGGFRIGSAEVGHTTIMSLALDQSPRFVRLEVGGFASLAFTRVRLESLAGTRLPVRVAEYGGDVRDPEHLLRFDNTMTVFNRSDVLSNWLSLTPLPRNFVVLGFEPI